VTAARPVERAWRDERTRLVAMLARRHGDLSLAEDAVQEAFAVAVRRWPVDGVPDRPGAWLNTVAANRAADLVRRRREEPMEEPMDDGERAPEPVSGTDAVFSLVLTCCHPSLAIESQVALTLRHVAGLTVAEIAAAFLVNEATMAKRLVRARRKIVDNRIAFSTPRADDLADRLDGVRTVLYLIFNEGYLSSADGPAVRAELCDEAVWLARQLHAASPDAETTALLALFFATNARRSARWDGEVLIPFAEQDPATWDRAAIVEARELMATTVGADRAEALGPCQVEAALALLHVMPVDGAPVPWDRVAELYGVLVQLTGSPVIEVNRAVAVGRAFGAEAGLDIVDRLSLEPTLVGYAPLHAARADLLERSGRPAAAGESWRRAAAASTSSAVRAAAIEHAQRCERIA
jgi:RNA polymerase sigma-70 factor, ECF subfamily